MAVITVVGAVEADVEGDVAAETALVVDVGISMLLAGHVTETELLR